MPFRNLQDVIFCGNYHGVFRAVLNNRAVHSFENNSIFFGNSCFQKSRDLSLSFLWHRFEIRITGNQKTTIGRIPEIFPWKYIICMCLCVFRCVDVLFHFLYSYISSTKQCVCYNQCFATGGDIQPSINVQSSLYEASIMAVRGNVTNSGHCIYCIFNIMSTKYIL